MAGLAGAFRRIDERYLGPEGDDLALEELAPVAARFLPAGGDVLEVGCGYGRNLVALSTLPARRVAGTDVSMEQLERARRRLAALPAGRRAGVHVARQEPWRLPFRDDTFDLVVLWQVLEHLFAPDEKCRLLAECARVLKDGGHLLIETPNQWFPVDYHDNRVPLAHWLLPPPAREWLTWRLRGERYQPSMYLSLPACERMLRDLPGVTRTEKATRVHFEDGYREAWRRIGGSQVRLKRLVFALLAPVHAALAPFGGSADLFLPSLRVVWRLHKGGDGRPGTAR